MKLFKVVKEGEIGNDAVFVIRASNYRGGKRSFCFIYNKTVCKLDNGCKVKKRVRLSFPKKALFSFSSINYIEGYSSYKDPVTKLEGFLKEYDISRDAGICLWGDVEIKSAVVGK